MSDLSDYVETALKRKGLDGASYRDLASRVDGVSKDTIRKIRAGTHGRPDEETLTALAELTGAPIEELRQAAGMPAGGGRFDLPPEADRLGSRERAAVVELVRLLAARSARQEKVTGGLGSRKGYGTAPGSDRTPTPDRARKR